MKKKGEANIQKYEAPEEKPMSGICSSCFWLENEASFSLLQGALLTWLEDLQLACQPMLGVQEGLNIYIHIFSQ